MDAGKRSLTRNGQQIHLNSKAFETLLVLVMHRGQVMEKADLLGAVWPDTIVEENNLTQHISKLRRALGEARGENRYIATVPGRGYCFTAVLRADNRRESEGKLESLEHISIGVLPFVNLSGDAERAYLTDGLTEESIATLGQIDPEHFSVIGRTTMMAYRDTKQTLTEIGRELGTAYLIEGSLRTEGEHVRITTRLIRATDQALMWSATYDGKPRSLLALQRQLADALAEQVRLSISPVRLRALENRHSQNAEAYDLYLRGRYFWNQFTPITTRKAIEYYTKATALDPDYALAWSGIADALCSSPVTGDVPAGSLLERAEAAAAHAVRCDADLAESQTSLGFFSFWLGWDWVESEKAYRKALAQDGSYAFGYRMLGILLSHQSRHRGANEAIRRARELDPLNAMNRALSAQIAFAARDPAAAIEFAREAIVIDPEFWIGHLQLAQALLDTGSTDAATESLNQAARLSGGNSKTLSLRGYLAATVGRSWEAQEILRTFDAIAEVRFVPPYARALVYAGLRENDLAFEWLRRAKDEHDVHLVFLTIDPKWDFLRSDPRFSMLLAECGFSGDPSRSTRGLGAKVPF